MKRKLQTLIAISSFITILSNTSTAQNGLNFDGVDDYVQTTNNGVTGNNARTVEAWIKTTANAVPANGGNQQVIVDWGSTLTGGRFTFNVLFNNAIRIEVNGNGISGNIPVNDGQWHHVAAVYDPSLPTKVYLYVDGVLDVSGNLTVTPNTGTTIKVRIGKRVDDQKMFSGSIDEVRIWNVARTAQQIFDNKNIEFCGTQNNLVGYYKFNNGIASGTNTSISTIQDYSSSGAPGILNNFSLTGSTSNFIGGSNLTLNAVDNTVTNNSNVLSANQNGATYQWLDCTNSNAPIAGQTNQSFTPTSNGNYAVQINYNGCSTISSCTEITTLGTSSIDLENKIALYPNPTNGNFKINAPENASITNITVRSLTGQIISSKDYVNGSNLDMNLDSNSGIYFITVSLNNSISKTFKLIKN